MPQSYSFLMDILVLKNYYEKHFFNSEETEKAIKALEAYQSIRTLEETSIEEMKSYLQRLIEKNENSLETLYALTRAAHLCENRDLYIYFTQIVERESIEENLKSHMVKTIGEEKTESLFRNLSLPPAGSPPESVIKYTRDLLSNMESQLSDQECRKALTANAHGIPAQAFDREKENFQNSEDLSSYLNDFHNRSVSTLQDHADSGKVWFEQIITQEVVDFVKNDREVLGGVLEGDKIFWTKIPYDVESWLKEEDRNSKRYYACHCPMAREALKDDSVKIPRAWCNCTSGYIQQRFQAIFGEPVHVNLLETVLDGDDRCRFAIEVPQKYIN